MIKTTVCAVTGVIAGIFGIALADPMNSTLGFALLLGAPVVVATLAAGTRGGRGFVKCGLACSIAMSLTLALGIAGSQHELSPMIAFPFSFLLLGVLTATLPVALGVAFEFKNGRAVD